MGSVICFSEMDTHWLFQDAGPSLAHRPLGQYMLWELLRVGWVVWPPLLNHSTSEVQALV